MNITPCLTFLDVIDHHYMCVTQEEFISQLQQPNEDSFMQYDEQEKPKKINIPSDAYDLILTDGNRQVQYHFHCINH
jgi:hypothetical protein